MQFDPKTGDRLRESAEVPRIGVLTLQGSFVEHIGILRLLGISAVRVDRPEQVHALQGLIIPGGESTTLGQLMNTSGLAKAIVEAAQRGLAVYGSCAGLILLGRRADSTSGGSLNLLDIEVSRNWYGRQIDSFELDLDIADIDGPRFRAVFIRAPAIQNVGDSVAVLARLPDGAPVAVRSARHLATHDCISFSSRWHERLPIAVPVSMQRQMLSATAEPPKATLQRKMRFSIRQWAFQLTLHHDDWIGQSVDSRFGDLVLHFTRRMQA